MQYLLWVPFVILLFVYCWQEKLKKFWPATILKVVLSAYISICAIYFAVSLGETWGYFIAAGLVFAVPADFFLQFIRSNLKKYRYGILFFGAMHICLLVSFYFVHPISWGEIVVAILFFSILICFQKSEKWNLGMVRFQLSIYTVLVICMASKAVSMFFVLPSLPALCIGLGGAFFFISDLFLGIWDYYEDKFVFLALNRVIYFIGQMLIAYWLVATFFAR